MIANGAVENTIGFQSQFEGEVSNLVDLVRLIKGFGGPYGAA